jgi:hypothetical protein
VVAVLVAPLALPACAAFRTEREGPAVIHQPTPETQAILERAVATALQRTAVTLAPDALTRTDSLQIEPVRPRDVEGLPLQGREVREVEQFHLLKRGRTCWLVQDRTGRRAELAGLECRYR